MKKYILSSVAFAFVIVFGLAIRAGAIVIPLDWNQSSDGTYLTTTYDVGATGDRISAVYADTIDATTIVGTVSIGTLQGGVLAGSPFLIEGDSGTTTLETTQTNSSFTITTHGNVTSTPAFTITTGNLVGIGTTTPTGLFAVEQGTETYSLVVGNTGSSTTSFVVEGVNGDGNVGIGVDNPGSKLTVAGAIVTEKNDLSDGVTITVDWASSQGHNVVLGGNRALSFTNVAVNQSIRIAVTQDSGGSRTLSYPSSVTWGASGAPTLETTGGQTNWLTFTSATSTETIHGRSGG